MVSMKLPKASTSSSTIKSTTTTTKINPILNKITYLSSLLPPNSLSTTSNLNPLGDLINLFKSFSLNPVNSNAVELELNRQIQQTSLHSLKSIFESLIIQGRLNGIFKSTASSKKVKLNNLTSSGGNGVSVKESESVTAVRIWLNKRFEEYIERVIEISTCHWDSGVRLSALNAAMSLLRTESQFLTSLHSSKQAQFATSTFSIIVKGLLLPKNETGLLSDETSEEWKKWFNRFDDIRFYFLKEASLICNTYSKSNASASTSTTPSTSLPPPQPASNLLSILEILTTMPTNASELNEWFCSTPIARKVKPTNSSKKRKASTALAANAKELLGREDGSTGVFDSSSSEDSDVEAEGSIKYSSKETKKLLPPLLTLATHRRLFQDCWLGLLSLGLNEVDAKRVLIILHRQVLPNLIDPKRLMDWLVDSTSGGGTVGVLALNGLFTLMTKHNLEYPNFYTQLYSLLDSSILHVRHRPRFFRLLEVFMSSSHLPSTLVASFIKRLCRLSLSAPPAAIVTVVPFIYNLLKLHVGCLGLIHRPAIEGFEDEVIGDPFNPLETDPTKTRALESSLWELATLQSHYLASVSGLAKIFKEVMNKQNYLMEDFLDHSFGSMFQTEINRKIRNAPALAPVPKRQPIGDSFFPSSQATNIKKTTEEGEEEAEEEDEPVDLISRIWEF